MSGFVKGPADHLMGGMNMRYVCMCWVKSYVAVLWRNVAIGMQEEHSRRI